jgi:predicted N-acetyltransferase YhbS
MMKPGTFQLGNASLHIGYPQIVQGNLRGFAREITEFNVPEEFRGKGEGSELLKEVCEQADQHDIMLILIADTEKLALYYGRFGFVPIQDKPILMVRKPYGATISIH